MAQGHISLSKRMWAFVMEDGNERRLFGNGFRKAFTMKCGQWFTARCSGCFLDTRFVNVVPMINIFKKGISVPFIIKIKLDQLKATTKATLPYR
jgi:hypothetical protein